MDFSSIISNKIITFSDLKDIFKAMDDAVSNTRQAYVEQQQENQFLPEHMQNHNVDYYSGRFRAFITFVDKSSTSYDDYNSFIRDFENRRSSIDFLGVDCSVHFGGPRPNDGTDNFSGSTLSLTVRDDSMQINTNFNHGEHSLDSVYQFIMQRISSAPEKYDRTIKSRTLINSKIGFAIVSIPVTILLASLIFLPIIRQLYGDTIVIFPLASLFLSAILGTAIGASITDHDYRPIQPPKKFSHIDSNSYKQVYKDDIDKYIETGEVMIGKNVYNDRHRLNIVKTEQKYSRALVPEIIAISIISILVILLSKFWH